MWIYQMNSQRFGAPSSPFIFMMMYIKLLK